jgi:hypothetical protein
MSSARTNPVAHPELAEAPGSMLATTAAKALAVLRVSLGFVFLWAFLDKTFGLGHDTVVAKSWLNASARRRAGSHRGLERRSEPTPGSGRRHRPVSRGANLRCS